MLASPIEIAMVSVGANAITEIIILALLGIFGFALWGKRKNKWHGLVSYTPTLLTTVGILGTFAGILAGLLEFDVDNIDSSIGGLLEGLKTAFITSLVGMLLSIAFKFIQNTNIVAVEANDGDVIENDVSAGQLYAVMQQQAKGIDELTRVIGGGENDSLVSQLKLFRSDVHDQNKKLHATTETAAASLADIQQVSKQQQERFADFEDRLWLKMQDFADMLSKSATEQVINALKEVISDFNNNLTEQFGENFKQLNEAVLKLVDWQENYKQQLLQMTEQYAQGVTAIIKTEESVAAISNESKVIPQAMQDLQQVMQVSQHQLNELERHLDAFQDIRNRAVEALPEIRTHIDAAVAGMKTATETMTQGIADSSDKLQKAIVTGAEELVEGSGKVHASLQSTSDVLSGNSEKIRSTLDDAVKESNSVLRELIAGLKDESKELNQSFREAGQSAISEADRVRRDFEVGIEAMRTNLAKSLSDLAEQQHAESQRVLAGMNNIAKEALANTNESVTKQVLAIDEALGHELQQVMTEMGRALAQISGRFTSDYQKLTDTMHRITRGTEV